MVPMPICVWKSPRPSDVSNLSGKKEKDLGQQGKLFFDPVPLNPRELRMFTLTSCPCCLVELGRKSRLCMPLTQRCLAVARLRRLQAL